VGRFSICQLGRTILLAIFCIPLFEGCRPSILGVDSPNAPTSGSDTSGSVFKSSLVVEASKESTGDEFNSIPAMATAQRVMTITNMGTINADSLKVSEDSPYFSISELDCDSSLAVGSSCELTLSFTSPGEGAFAATLSVEYSAGGSAGKATTTVSGIGVAIGSKILPQYPKYGSKWNDYVKNNGATVYTASDAKCEGTESGSYFIACIHGGEKRKFSAPLLKSCSDLVFRDELDAFDWNCSLDSAGSVVIKSFGLKEGKNLSDLLNASGWKNNRMLVYRTGNLVYASDSTAWWANAISTSLTSGLTASKIYVISSNVTRTSGFNVADRSAVVVMPGATLTFTLATTATMINGNGRKFFWMEGKVKGTGGGNAIELGQSAWMSRFQNLSYEGASSFTLHSGAGSSGKHLFKNVSVVSYQAYGGPAIYALGNVFDVIVTGGRFSGQMACISDTGARNVYYNIHCSGNDSSVFSYYAIGMAGQRKVFAQILLTNTGTYGFGPAVLNGISGGTVLGATSARNSVSGGSHGGYMFYNVTNTTGFNIAGVDVNYALIGAKGDNRFGQIAADHTRSLVEVFGNGNQFYNYAMTGEHTGFDYSHNASTKACYIDPAVTTAGINSDCVSTDGMTVSKDVSLSGSFVGELTENDSSNLSDTGTAVPFSTSLDFLNFENPWRSWGKAFGQWGASRPYWTSNGTLSSDWGFFACDSLGGNKTCSLWDWRLKKSDTVLRNKSGDGVNENEPFVPGETCPSAVQGNKTATNYYGETFLINAVEIIGDASGNDNALCESNEQCIYMPNIGAYQGEGDLLDACAFEDGTVTGVTMRAYSENGV